MILIKGGLLEALDVLANDWRVCVYVQYVCGVREVLGKIILYEFLSLSQQVIKRTALCSESL